MNIIKWTVRIGLLLFVAASIGYAFQQEFKWGSSDVATPAAAERAITAETVNGVPDHVTAYYFHGNYRCANCKKIEEYSRIAIKEGFVRELKDGRLGFDIINVEEQPNRHFIRDYSLVTKSLVLVLKDGDRQIRFKNLDLVWQLLGSREKFVEYVQNEVESFLGEVRR